MRFKMCIRDRRPALGVTEPGAIAYAVSKAKSYVPGELEQVTLLLNSGMYKNAYTCGIPNSHFYGNEYAAALGAVAGKPEKELEDVYKRQMPITALYYPSFVALVNEDQVENVELTLGNSFMFSHAEIVE